MTMSQTYNKWNLLDLPQKNHKNVTIFSISTAYECSACFLVDTKASQNHDNVTIFSIRNTTYEGSVYYYKSAAKP